MLKIVKLLTLLTRLIFCDCLSAFSVRIMNNRYQTALRNRMNSNKQEPSVSSNTANNSNIIILTLDRHKNGIWITKLRDALSYLCDEEFECIQPQIITLESLQMSDYAQGTIPSDWLCLINRVSDAASPIEVKACQALLATAGIWGIPTYNGSKCYGIGSNKWLHHQILRRAGLSIPRSTIITYTSNDSFKIYREKFIERVRQLMENQNVPLPLLIKPNSGGFGNGIRVIFSLEQLPSIIESLYNDPGFLFSDGVVLVQELIKPFQNKVYRVWFLDGKVKCAVERSSSDFVENQSWMSDNIAAPELNAFSGGCAGTDGSCSLDEMESVSRNSVSSLESHKTTSESRPWNVPDHVSAEIEVLLKYLSDDCYTGSVEFLCNKDESDRVYFDLNMLSTLPVNINEEWMDLARSILRFALKGEQKESKLLCK